VLFNEAVHGTHMTTDEVPGLVHKMSGGGSTSILAYTDCGKRFVLNSASVTRREINCMACIAAGCR
jgi:hypothetical protein